jgi:hypothetical protein
MPQSNRHPDGDIKRFYELEVMGSVLMLTGLGHPDASIRVIDLFDLCLRLK